MKAYLIAALLASTAASAQAADTFNPQASIFFGKIDTKSVPLEMSRWCIDNGKQDVAQRDWEHRATGKSTFSCTLETEGDGNAGSPTVVTFTYHFVRTTKSTLRLERVT